MILTDRSVKTQIKYQVPWFFNQEYPLFVKFLEYYYQWVETHDDNFKYGVLAIIDNFNRLKDIDQTIEQLIPIFKNPYFRNVPDRTSVQRRLFIKRMVDLYRSKGSIKSLNLLIKIILGEQVDVWYPRDLLARASNNESESFYYAYLEVTNPILNTMFELQTNDIEINGISVLVSSVSKHLDYYELILDFDQVEYPQIKTETDVYFQGVKIGVLVPMVESVSFVSGSRINRQGELLYIYSDNQQAPAVCKVKRVKPGRIDSYRILRRGQGYQLGDTFVGYIGSTEFLAVVSNVTPTGEIGRITIQKNVAITDTVPKIISRSTTGIGANIEWFSSAFSVIQEIEVIDGGINLVGPFTTSMDPSVFTTTTISIAKKTQQSDTNNLGNFNLLADNLLWQDHSYVMNFSSNYTEFPRTEIISLFKPLGSKLFYNKTELLDCSVDTLPSNTVFEDLVQELAVKVENILIANRQTSFIPSSRKYTNDTPLVYVGNYPVSQVNTEYCFEVKPEIGTMSFTTIEDETLDKLENAVLSLTTALEISN